MPHPLVGVWRLHSCEHELPGGRSWRPFGPKPKGRLIYLEDGRMSVMLMDPRRPRTGRGLFEAAEEEQATFARGFMAYTGRWTARGAAVFHQVDVSLFPDWIGRTQRRGFKIRGDRATFETRPFLVEGVRHVARLVWKREPPSQVPPR